MKTMTLPIGPLMPTAQALGSLPWWIAISTPFVATKWPGWPQMGLTAVAIWFACKWTLVLRLSDRLPLRRRLGYWLLWPGMDPKPFAAKAHSGTRAGILPGALGVVLGATLITMPALAALPERPLMGGWMGWVGLILLLHFGVFHLLAVFWQGCGVPVRPLMENPWAARSVADFWGRRWNHAFQEVAHRLLFRPTAKRAGPAAAMLLVFLASGLVHELVITVPAGAAHGGPTLYFMVQGIGLLVERRWKLGGVLNRVFAWGIVAVPVPLLFPPPFIEKVIAPMLDALTAPLR